MEVPTVIKDEISRFVETRPWDNNMVRNPGLRITADDMAHIIKSVYTD